MGTEIYLDTNSNNKIIFGDADYWSQELNSLAYYTQAAVVDGFTTSIVIHVNVDIIEDMLAGETDARKRLVYANVIAHELGHAMGLLDNPPNQNSIMNYGYNLFSTTYPEPMDICGVRVFYADKEENE